MDKENLFTSGEQAREKGRIGGSRSTPAKQFAQIKWCKPSCPIFPCFCQALSKKEYNGECALKKFPTKIQNKTLRLLTQGLDGFNNEMKDMILEYSNEVQAMPKYRVFVDKNGEEHKVPSTDYLTFKDKLINTSIKLKDSVYGKKEDITMKAEGTINIKDLQEAWKRRKEEK